MANLTHVELITPERVLFSGEAEAVVLRADGADTTFLANHMDYIAAVDICVLRLEGVQATAASSGATGPASAGIPAGGAATPAGGAATPAGGAATPGEPTPLGEVRAAVHGGFVKVADNKVTIVAGVAELAEEIDVERAQRALEAAEGQLSAGDVVEAEAAAARARVRIAAAVKLKADLSRL
jgi:F-type H+-transporting ATPase subunit epsilon